MRDGVAGVFFVSGHTAGFVEKYEVSCGEAAGGRLGWLFLNQLSEIICRTVDNQQVRPGLVENDLLESV